MHVNCGKISCLSSRLSRRSHSDCVSGPFRSQSRTGKRHLNSKRVLPGIAQRFPLRSDEAHRRKAELDYVDYRNANGVHGKNPIDERHLSNGVPDSGFVELDQDLKSLDGAKTQNGLWQKLSGIRSLFAYLTNRKELGRRGEGLVLLTVATTALVFFPPFVMRGVVNAAGYFAVAYGIVSAFSGLLALGGSFSPLPVPRTNAQFVDRGIFRFVRHPFYSGLLLIALGVSVITGNEFRLLMTAALYWIFDQTIQGEEKDLEQIYPEYSTYKLKVAKLIPFVY